jgi:2-desacetyl-2-hydroxyethyl bacteriochlorophyllide A dehydrogenase
LVKVVASAVSVGTEMRVYRGIQEKNQSFPVTPGYSNAGVVVEAGPGALFREGDRVTAGGTQSNVRLLWGAHASHVTVSSHDAVPLPESVDFMAGAATRMGAIARRGWELVKSGSGEKVLVIGLGVIGQMSARVFRAAGAETVAVDLAPSRIESALADGVDARLISSLQDAGSVFPGGADVIVDATGSQAVLVEAIALAKSFAWNDDPQNPTKYLIQGSFPDTLTLPYGHAFLKQMIYFFPRDCQPKDKRAFLDDLDSGRITINGILRPHPAEEAGDVYRRCDAGDPDLIAPILLW